jgi:hypothetical protein
MKITIDFEDGSEIQEHWLQGADRIVKHGAWVTLKFKHPNTGSNIFIANVWDKDDNPVTINKPNKEIGNGVRSAGRVR